MDSYPDDWLVGVFPLVFAVDAVLDSSDSEGDDEKKKRGLFDRFLDALAASLSDDDNQDTSPDRRRTVSLFRPDEEDSSDEDETARPRVRSNNMSPGLGFGRRFSSRQSTVSEIDASYAEALAHGQVFFQRARIEAVSSKYGFPPSKDPEGKKSLAHAIPRALRSRNRNQLATLFEERPLDGILPAGWLEKHVHALPSVILVVCSVSSNPKEQSEQDQRLYETIEHLQHSLVEKRQCKIHVVGLMDNLITTGQGQEWSKAVINHMAGEDSGSSNVDFNVRVDLLRITTDLQSTASNLPTSTALKLFHRTIREESMAYYLGEARRAKLKLANVTESRKKRASPPAQLLPIVIRYCFKVAMFYEFQWKHGKSLRYMTEAYKYIALYYQYLLTQQSDLAIDDDTSSVTSAHSGTDADSGVEVALKDNSSIDRTMWSEVIPLPPDDMVHQCRAVADWLNMKLLWAGLGSRTEGGFVAASDQWRHHCRVFCTKRDSSKINVPDWNEWAFITKQRLVVSQLLERHPPSPALASKLSSEVLLRCSPWRNFESSVEAFLQLAYELEKLEGLEGSSPQPMEGDSERSNPMRPRYVGGLEFGEITVKLRDEKKVNHREKALEIVRRAISMFEAELHEEKRGFYAENDFDESSSSRTGARLYYLAGGIQLGMGQHEDAASHLTKAAKQARGWHELELSIRRMLIECYGKHIPASSESNESSQALASMILDSYFNAQMSSGDLRKALGHFASVAGGESLKWYHSSLDEEDSSLPFSFAVSFPEKTHATAGDTVRASVLVTSNLDYAVHVNSAVLLSLAGELPIPANDLLSATNASEGSDGGIIIQAKTAIIISTDVELPKDVSMIETDESGNGGELQGVAGKGSFAKSARPRSAGITAAGGARLVSEDKISPGNSRSQGWSLRFLGGKPLRCDGLRLSFYPVAAQKAAGVDSVTFIELTIEKQKSRTAADIKRTPFEEENFIASAWSRPLRLPLSRGPRSIRVLGHMPQMIITNLTDSVTDGKTLEGTVNRILLKLAAGAEERCSDLKIDVSCFSVLMTDSGSTKRLVSGEELTAQADNSVDMKNAIYRTPVLVAANSVEQAVATEYGYELPVGWGVAGTGQSNTGLTLPSMKGGESSYIYLDVFRPASSISPAASAGVDGAQSESAITDSSLCKTDLYVTVSYRQEKPKLQKPKRGRRAVRKPPVMSSRASSDQGTDTAQPPSAPEVSESSKVETSTEQVSLEFAGSIVWARPLAATFATGGQTGSPSSLRRLSDTTGSDSGVVADGESVTTYCSLKLDPSMDGLKAEIVGVRFQPTADSESPLHLTLKSGSHDGVLYTPQGPTGLVTRGSQLTVAYTVQTSLKEGCADATGSLGAVLVDWCPPALPLPSEVTSSDSISGIQAHGPLVLKNPSSVCFRGPSLSIEKPPFETKAIDVDVEPHVAAPFEIAWSIENKADSDLTLSVELDDSDTSWLVSGLAAGHLTFAPSESQVLVYTVLATQPGLLRRPSLKVRDAKSRRWIHDANTSLFVFP